MPDNKKQGRSNKAMTFLSAFLQPWQDYFWPGYRRYRRCLPFITDEFQITAHSGMGGQLHDVWRGRRRCRQRLALL